MLDLKKTNLTKLSDVGHEFELVLPEVGTRTGAFITVRGEQSQPVRDFSRRQFNLMQQKEIVAKRRGKDAEPMSLDEAEDISIDSAYVRIIGWKGVTEGPQALDFNEANAKRVLREHPWIRDAVIKESAELGNFIKG